MTGHKIAKIWDTEQECALFITDDGGLFINQGGAMYGFNFKALTKKKKTEIIESLDQFKEDKEAEE